MENTREGRNDGKKETKGKIEKEKMEKSSGSSGGAVVVVTEN